MAPTTRKAPWEENYDWVLTIHGGPPAAHRPTADGPPRLVQLDLKPDSHMKDVVNRLRKCTNETEATSIVRGIHEKFWHAKARDLANMLNKLNLPKSVVGLANVVVQTCDVCRRYARHMNKPTIRAELAGFFNDQVQADL